MQGFDDPDRLPLLKSWPRLAKRALLVVNSMLKVSFDIELGRRLDCATYHAREHAAHERLRLDSDSNREVFRLVHARFGRMDPKKRTLYTRAERFRILELKALNAGGSTVPRRDVGALHPGRTCHPASVTSFA
jgi:hypothetical protein